MKVNDYVRTKYGIAKIIGIFPEKTMIFIETDNGLGNCSSSQNGKLRKGIIILEEDYRNFIDNNIKERPIDLIQIGDYVNGHRVLDIYKDINGQYRMKFGENDLVLANKSNYDNYYLFEEDIKSIVTKEQFESMEYKVKE